MKNKILLLLGLMISIGCSESYDKKSVILFEDKNYIIYTSEEELKNAFGDWLKLQNNNEFVIKNDKPLYVEIEKTVKQNRNIFKLASQLDKVDRLNYRTADLLEFKRAFIFDKITKSNVHFEIEKVSCGRLFKIKDEVVFSIMDCIVQTTHNSGFAQLLVLL